MTRNLAPSPDEAAANSHLAPNASMDTETQMDPVIIDASDSGDPQAHTS